MGKTEFGDNVKLEFRGPYHCAEQLMGAAWLAKKCPSRITSRTPAGNRGLFVSVGRELIAEP